MFRERIFRDLEFLQVNFRFGLYRHRSLSTHGSTVLLFFLALVICFTIIIFVRLKSWFRQLEKELEFRVIPRHVPAAYELKWWTTAVCHHRNIHLVV